MASIYTVGTDKQFYRSKAVNKEYSQTKSGSLVQLIMASSILLGEIISICKTDNPLGNLSKLS